MHRTTFTRLLQAGAVAALATTGAAASAQFAGTWMVHAGVNHIDPKVSSGNLSAPAQPGTKVDVDAATSLTVAASYMLTDHVSAALYVGLGYKHDLTGSGSVAGIGKIGSVKQVSPTLFAQYRFFETNDIMRPYLGLGITYARFYDEEGSSVLTALTNVGGAPTRMSVDSAWGWSPQVGAQFSFDKHWYADVAVVKTYLKTTNHLSTGQSIELKLDPVSVNLSVGYRF